MTFKRFMGDQMGFQCVALSYFVTMALVPFLAFLFAFSDGLGVSDRVSEFLNGLTIISHEGLELLNEKAKNIIDVAQSGLVGAISAALFLWTILWMMFQIERVFNNVWGIKKVPRKIYKRFSFYLLVLCMTPFIILVFSTGIAMFGNLNRLIGLDVKQLRFFIKFLAVMGGCLVTALSLSAMYKFIPAAKVCYINAFLAAMIISPIFLGFQFLYLKTQLFMSRLNGVYGVLAAIPLFLLWLNLSWQIIIYGAELSYSLQNVDSEKQ